MCLRNLVEQLEDASMGWYRVERRTPHLPVKSTLGVRKVYGDGNAVSCTYVIRKISYELKGGA